MTTTRLPDVSQVLNGTGPWLPGQLAGFPKTRIHDDLTSIAAYGTGLSRFAVISLPGQVGTQAQSTAVDAGAAQVEFQDGTAALIRTPLLTVVLASSRFGGPVFLLAGPVTPAALLRVASRLMARSVVLP